MKLIYTTTKLEVKVGDVIVKDRMSSDPMAGKVTLEVTDIVKPHKPGSTGKVYVRENGQLSPWAYFPSVIGAEWIEREDQGYVAPSDEPTYSIYRHYADSTWASKFIKGGLTLAEAQAHCKDPATCVAGEWFDGYEEE